MESQFKKWKSRVSSLGHLLTNQEKITPKQQLEIRALENRRDDPDQKPLTSTMEETLARLIAQRDAPDVLPEGAKSHLDDVFIYEYYGRKRLEFNKYMDKGNLCEQDSLDLVSKVDGFFYSKNDIQYSNDFIIGTPDNVQNWVKDTKTNFDMKSFDKADVTQIYEWQVKGYIWLLLKETNNNYKGELIYCLVNNPYVQFENEKTSVFYKMGGLPDDDETWIEARKQLERNMIFDTTAWLNLREPSKLTGELELKNRNYIWENEDRKSLNVHPLCRIKRFDIILNTRDIAFIKRRIKLSREYLIQRELVELRKMEQPTLFKWDNQ